MAAAFLLPLLWMLSVSLKPTREVLTTDLLPAHPIVDAYRAVIGVNVGPDTKTTRDRAVEGGTFNYALYCRNTLIVTVLSLIGMILSGTITAYGFARLDFPGRNLLFAVCLATMMVPFPVIMVPTYLIFKYLGWIGTFRPLWAPAWLGSVFNIFLLRQFFLGLPRELEESALLDGCSRWGCFWRIILPLSKPALAVVALLHCLAVWNDLIGPLVYLSHQDQFTLALGLQFLQSRSGDTP